MTNKLFTAKSIIAGLLIAQVIATSHVYLSNWRLHHAISDLQRGRLVRCAHGPRDGWYGYRALKALGWRQTKSN